LGTGEGLRGVGDGVTTGGYTVCMLARFGGGYGWVERLKGLKGVWRNWGLGMGGGEARLGGKNS